MRTFKLLNVVKITDSDIKAKRLEMLGYKEVKESEVIEEVDTEEVATDEVIEEVAEEVAEEVEPEPKKKAPVKKTTKEG